MDVRIPWRLQILSHAGIAFIGGFIGSLNSPLWAGLGLLVVGVVLIHLLLPSVMQLWIAIVNGFLRATGSYSSAGRGSKMFMYMTPMYLMVPIGAYLAYLTFDHISPYTIDRVLPVAIGLFLVLVDCLVEAATARK